MNAVECVVVGAGPAGLTAATYLARFHRSVTVYDAGSSRASLIQASHNYPGMGRHGMPGKKLLSQLLRQSQHFGARVTNDDPIVDVRSDENVGDAPRFTLASAHGVSIRAQRVLIATGMDDVLPPSLQSQAAIRRGLVRLCSICDGYETLGKCVAVLGAGSAALTHALFLRTFCDDVTAVLVGGDMDGNFETLSSQAEWARVAVVHADIAAINICNNDVTVTDHTGRVYRFDCIYPAMGANYRSGPVRRLDIAHTKEGAIKIDDHCQTSVPGIFAAGDVTPSVKQICVAIAQGAIAAIAMHNSLDRNMRV